MKPQKDLRSIIKSAQGVRSVRIDDTDIDSSSLEKQEIERKILDNERFASDTLDRKWLAKWAAVVVSLWLLAVLALLFLNCYIFLSDTVIVTLLGTTTLNVLGLSYIVLKGHFKTEM